MRARLRQLVPLLAALVFLAGAAAVAAPVHAAAAATKGAGKTRVVLGKQAHGALAKRGVTLRAGGAAKRSGRRLSLPVRSGSVRASVAVVRHAGAIVLRSGRRTVRLRQLRLTVVAGGGNLTARLGRYRYTVSRLRGVDEVPFNPIEGLVRFSGAQVRLTAEMRRLLSRRLGGARLPRVLGRLEVRARVAIAPPDTADAEPLPRPAEAVDVESVRIFRWRMRESLICYLHSEGGPGVGHSEDVVGYREAYPPEHMNPESKCAGKPQEELVYTVDYPAATGSGWYDPASGTAALRAEGVVRFDKDVFGLHVETTAPQLELAGPASRLLHIYTERGLQRRAVTADLPELRPCAAGWEVAQQADGDWVHTLTRVPGRVPTGPTKGNFAGYYPPGKPFGWVTVEFLVPGEAVEPGEECG